jgi:hypothetical protein
MVKFQVIEKLSSLILGQLFAFQALDAWNTDPVPDQRDVYLEKAGQVLCDGCQGFFLIELTFFRSTQVRGHHYY